jgi:Phosphopantetheine attachment site
MGVESKYCQLVWESPSLTPAASIFQDRFAAFRRSQGLRAMTIDVSYLTSVGFVADHYEYVDYFKAMGLKFMQNRDLHSLLSVAMQGTAAHPAQVMCGLPFNEHDERRYWIHDDRFAALRNCSRETRPGAGSVISLSEELRRCTDMAAAVDIVAAALVQRLARLMMMSEEDIDAGRPLNAYGVDSLVAVEVRNWITRETAVEVSVFEVMANVPMRQLASDLAGKTKLFQGTQGSE